MRKAIKLLVLLFTVCFSQTVTADYIDDINNQKYGNGHHVIYEMNVGAFTAAGTFQAAQAQLAELKRIGVDIVWLMPIYPRGGGINSPYAAKDFQQVNSSYGTIADLKAFVAAAHTLDMQVWLDWVPNHTATDATWVTTHPEYYKKSGNNFVHPNNYGDVYQLNYGNADLTKAMTDCLKFWIDEADIDGYRCDYISSPEIPTSYWQTAIPEIKAYKSGKTITFLGEADITTDATRLKTAGFDYDYAWQFQGQLVNFGSSGNAAARPKAFANTLISNQDGISFGRMLYLTNHDQNGNDGGHTLTSFYGANRYPLTVLTFTLWGMPLIYNGQDIGGNQVLNYFTDEKIAWGSVDERMQNTIRTLSALKHSVAAFHDGKTTAEMHTVEWLTVTNNTAVLAYRCKYGDSEALVLLNFGTAAGTATVTGINAGEYGLWLDSETIGQGVSRQQVSLNATYTFSLGAKGYQVYVKGQFSEEAIPEKQYETYTPTLDSENEVSVFLETATEGVYNVWAWGDLGGGEAYTLSGSWPGDAMTLMGKNANGRPVYKYVQTKTDGIPANIIITRYDGGSEAKRLWDGAPFVNHGYYVEGISYNESNLPGIITTTGITEVRAEKLTKDYIYTLSGIRVGEDAPEGIYIRNGHKFIKQ